MTLIPLANQEYIALWNSTPYTNFKMFDWGVSNVYGITFAQFFQTNPSATQQRSLSVATQSTQGFPNGRVILEGNIARIPSDLWTHSSGLCTSWCIRLARILEVHDRVQFYHGLDHRLATFATNPPPESGSQIRINVPAGRERPTDAEGEWDAEQVVALDSSARQVFVIPPGNARGATHEHRYKRWRATWNPNLKVLPQLPNGQWVQNTTLLVRKSVPGNPPAVYNNIYHPGGFSDKWRAAMAICLQKMFTETGILCMFRGQDPQTGMLGFNGMIRWDFNPRMPNGSGQSCTFTVNIPNPNGGTIMTGHRLTFRPEGTAQTEAEALDHFTDFLVLNSLNLPNRLGQFLADDHELYGIFINLWESAKVAWGRPVAAAV